MKWRFGGGPDDSCRGMWWAQVGRWRLRRVIPFEGGYWVPGLFRWVMTPAGLRNLRREFRTQYGARMAVEAEQRRCA